VKEVQVFPRFSVILLMDLVSKHISKTKASPTPGALKMYLMVEVKLHGF
jgi:hypothetical protein